jgi:hypothetical protein
MRSVLALAARDDWEIYHLDVKSAYLNGVLDDNQVIYMQQPPGYVVEGHEKHVLRLKKTLYGLKQSGRRWYEKLQGVLSEFEMKRCEVDHAVFVRHYDDGGIVVIVVHVDDLSSQVQ